MNSNRDLKLNRDRCEQVEKLLGQINALLIAEDRAATCYIQIREALLDAAVPLHQAMAMYRLAIGGQERVGDGNNGHQVKGDL